MFWLQIFGDLGMTKNNKGSIDNLLQAAAALHLKYTLCYFGSQVFFSRKCVRWNSLWDLKKAEVFVYNQSSSTTYTLSHWRLCRFTADDLNLIENYAKQSSVMVYKYICYTGRTIRCYGVQIYMLFTPDGPALWCSTYKYICYIYLDCPAWSNLY